MNELKSLNDGLACPEGPDLFGDGRVIFVETFRRRIPFWAPGNGVHAFADVGGAPNAAMGGRDGVYVAQHGSSARTWPSSRPTAPSIQKG